MGVQTALLNLGSQRAKMYDSDNSWSYEELVDGIKKWHEEDKKSRTDFSNILEHLG